MSAPTPAPAPELPPPPPPSAVPPAAPGRSPLSRFLWRGAFLALAALVSLFLYWWGSDRLTHSVTDDAFVDGHIVNVAPQTVSGRLVRFWIDEDERVEQGQLLAEIDSVPYRDQVNIARSKVDLAQTELRRQEAALARLRLEVPIQIEIARRSLAVAKVDHARAKETLRLTEDEVEKEIEEARAALEVAKADLVLAQLEYTRYTRLEKEEAAPARRAQEVTRARDAAEARKNLSEAKLAKAAGRPDAHRGGEIDPGGSRGDLPEGRQGP